MSFQVGAARRAHGIPYPTLYAVPQTLRDYTPAPAAAPAAATPAADKEARNPLITPEEAYAFNSVQRGHQNSLENMPLVSALAIVSWGFPIVSGFALISWALGRIFYMNGYKAGPEKRNNVFTILLTYPALLTLWGTTLATAIFFFNGTKPYKYA
jgi:hypothetical protein